MNSFTSPWHFVLAEVGGDGFVHRGAGLVDETDLHAGVAEKRPALTGGFVEGARTLAAAGDQDGEHAFCFGLQGEELFADRAAGELGAAGGEEARGFFKADEGFGDVARDPAVGHAGERVGFHHDQGNAAEQRGEDGRSGDVASRC